MAGPVVGENAARSFKLTNYCDTNRFESPDETNELLREFRSLFRDRVTNENLLELTNGLGNSIIPMPLNLIIIQGAAIISPEVDSCEDSGYITCNSLLSRFYARGITKFNSITINLFMCANINWYDNFYAGLPEKIVKGFMKCAKKAGAAAISSSVVMSEYVLIGGVVTSICHINDIMACDEAKPGDVLILTKPLGTLLGARANCEHMKKWFKNEAKCPPHFYDHVAQAYESAVNFMLLSNEHASLAMRKYKAHAAIDVNGCSLYDAAQELVSMQKNDVDFIIKSIPVIMHTDKIDQYLRTDLCGGRSEELSGGLLICLTKEDSAFFKYEMSKHDQECYTIGEVKDGSKTVILERDITIYQYKQYTIYQ